MVDNSIIIAFVVFCIAMCTLTFFIGRDTGSSKRNGSINFKKNKNSNILKTPAAIRLSEFLELVGKCYNMEQAHFECFRYAGDNGDIIAVQYAMNESVGGVGSVDVDGVSGSSTVDPNDIANRVTTIVNNRIMQLNVGMISDDNSKTAVLPMIMNAYVELDVDFQEVK